MPIQIRSIASKLTLINGVLGLLFLTIALGGLFRQAGMVDSVQQVMVADAAHSLTAAKMNIAFKRQVQEWKNVLLRGSNPQQMDKYWGRFGQHQQSIQAMGERLAADVRDDRARQLLQQFLRSHQPLLAAYDQGRRAFIAAGFDPAAGDKAVKGLDREPSKLLDQIAERLELLATEHTAKVAGESAQQVQLTATILVAVVLVIAAALSLLTQKMVTRPLTVTASALEAFSRGELGQTLDQERQDEIGSLNRSAVALQQTRLLVIEQLQQTLGKLNNATGQLNQVAHSISDGIAEQGSRTDQVATAMEEMSATSQEVSNYAASAANAADEADQASQQGQEVMTATISTINEAAGQIGQTAEVINKLEDDTNSISTVLDVIRGIAEQTNLLALNAAIEAARAGEQGRGFAVVADEVRHLAQRTQDSTAEIQQIIETVQAGARNAVTAIGSGQSQTQEGVEHVSEAGDKLQSITGSVEAIRDMNRQIATAASQQHSVASDINENIVELTTIASNNSQASEQTLACCSDVETVTEELSELIHNLQQH